MQYTQLHKQLPNIALVLLIIVVILPLLTLAVVGSHSRYAADDFQNVAGINEFGLMGYQVERYQNWTGRFAYIFTNSLVYLLGPNIVPVLPFLALLALSSIWYFVFKSIGHLCNWKRIHLLASLLSLTLVLSTFASMENIRQVLFWQSGLISYASPMILLPCLLLCCIKMLQYEVSDKEPPKSLYFMVPIIAFISSAYTEIYAVAQIILLISLIVYCLAYLSPQLRKKTCVLLGIALVSALLSTLAVVVAPGNAIRQSFYPQPPALPLLLKMVWQHSFIFMGRQFKNNYLFMEIALFVPLVGSLLSDDQQTKTYPPNVFKTRGPINSIALLTVGMLIFISTFVATAWGTSNYPVPRASSIATYILSVCLVIVGFTVGNELRKSFSGNKKINFIIGLISLVFILLGTIRTTRNQIFIELPVAQEFSKQWDTRDTILRAAAENQVDFIEVDEIPNYYGLEQLKQYSPDYQWINSEMSRYYNISSIYLKTYDK